MLHSLICSLFLFPVVIHNFGFFTCPIFHETHTPALQLAKTSYWKDWWHLTICYNIIEGRFPYDTKQEITGKTFFFNVPSKYEKMKAHKICIIWTLLYLINNFLWKNVHSNKNEDFFNIVKNFFNHHLLYDIEWNGDKWNIKLL